MAKILSESHLRQLQNLAAKIPGCDLMDTAAELAVLIEDVREDIPEQKRISTGRYSIVKELGRELYVLLRDLDLEALAFASSLFRIPGSDPFVRSSAVQVLAQAALGGEDLGTVLRVFESAAAESDWIVRECCSGLVRPLVKAFSQELRTWYLELVKSPDPNLRRFVSESLRPVVENRWFHKDPDYALGIIKNLFTESDPYPRTSVGNSLSDWLRVDQEQTWPIVCQLARSGNPNSYWIAYRACRNLVKKNPSEVLELLGVDEYRYKGRVYRKPPG